MYSIHLDSFQEFPDGRVPLPRQHDVEWEEEYDILRERVHKKISLFAMIKAVTELEGLPLSKLRDMEGNWVINWFRAFRHYGDPGEDQLPDPYNAPPELIDRLTAMSHTSRVAYYRRFWSVNDIIRHIAPRELSQWRPACVSLEITRDWADAPNGDIPPLPTQPTFTASHCVSIVEVDPDARRFVFPNSWGEGWGDKGWGTLPIRDLNDSIVEGYTMDLIEARFPYTAREGLTKVYWRTTCVDGVRLYCFEVWDTALNRPVAWTFVSNRFNGLQVEEFFVWPSYRGRGLGKWMACKVRELAKAIRLPLVAWIAFADADRIHEPDVVKVLAELGLHIHNTISRTVAYVATNLARTGELHKPTIPRKPAAHPGSLSDVQDKPKESDDSESADPVALASQGHLFNESDIDNLQKLYDAVEADKNRKPYVVRRVWYATNRRPLSPWNVARGYGGKISDKVFYGQCNVLVPADRRFGALGRGLFWRIRTGVDDRVKLKEIQPWKSAPEFWEKLSTESSDIESSDSLVFIHGFNVSFTQAAERTAQLAHDLGIGGVAAFFSWPSRASSWWYSADEATIESSEEDIIDFLKTFARKVKPSRVHVLAHSMGNRALLRAIQAIATKVSEEDSIRLGQVFFCAPDVDHRTFKRQAKPLPKISDRATLYMSSKDKAVWLSKIKHLGPRAGLFPPPLIMEGLDTINVPFRGEYDLFGHSYFGEPSHVLQDMRLLISDSSIVPDDPRRASRLSQVLTQESEIYWEFNSKEESKGQA